jgi:hypothetical protein
MMMKVMVAVECSGEMVVVAKMIVVEMIMILVMVK